ncbi:MAG: YjbQ family protein [Bacteroidales bacterium]|nr:YjbQ family protein [Bacteroidales bacterium]
METLSIKTHSRTEMIDITPMVADAVKAQGIEEGVCILYNPHTTAAITINEGADPSVQSDIRKALSGLIPPHDHPQIHYEHTEGNADSHIKSSLIGTSQLVIISNSQLVLGTWQSIFFCEFDGPRTRKVHLKILRG